MTSERFKVLGAVSNPPNPFLNGALEWDGPPPEVELQVYDDVSRTILSRNDSPDLPFTWSLNPYRGCMHACAYCYARPTHEYLDFGAGTDFDRRIVVKRDAPALLHDAFMKRSWTGELLMFSGNTDCYQPLEATYGLTRACLEVCRDFHNPVAIITKSCLIERDLDVLVELNRRTRLYVTVSLPFWDADNARAIEPFVPTPRRRIKTIAALAEAGLDVAVNVAPIIPGLNDSDIPRILEAARAAGARRAGHTLVRLPGPVAAVFDERLRKALPLRAEKVLRRIAEAREEPGAHSTFHRRMVGAGRYWDAISLLFRTTCARLGLATGATEILVPTGAPATFRRPERGPKQLSLFDP